MAGPEATKQVTATVPLKKPDKTTYKATAKIRATEDSKKTCDIVVTDVKAGKDANVVYEKISQKQGEEYLKALVWTERCSNGIHIMYYTPAG